MSSDRDDKDVLRGRTLQVYRFIIRHGEPVRVRDIQRGLGLSTPSLVTYHLDKLKEASLIKEDGQGYVADKVLLANFVRFRNALIPRYFFYFLFFTLGTALELTLFAPQVASREYLIAVTFTAAASIAFAIETYSHWRGI